MRNHSRTPTRGDATGQPTECEDSPISLKPKVGILVLSGYGLRVAVERGHLVVNDGIGHQRRGGRLHRATAGLKRLVVLGHSGTISFEALRWLHDIGASFVQLDADGTVIVASGPSGLDDARLRRAQALAATNGVGIALARELLERKLAGQAEVLTRLPESEPTITVIEDALQELPHAGTPARLRSIEAQAAAAYWSAWAPVTIQFAKRDQLRIPAHWRIFGTRSSPISGATRSASNPINALLNYIYAILETEVQVAILAIGLDPGMGVLHADLKSRDSFVFDVIEPLRQVVDGYVLALLEERTFASREFFETRQGVCRLMPPLPQALAEMAPRLAKLAAPVVEQVAQRLSRGQGSAAQPLTVPTLLTQSNRSAGRDRVRTAAKRSAAPLKLEAPAACRECGVILEDPTRAYCGNCLPSYALEAVATFSASGRVKLAALRASGTDPSHGGEVAMKRGAKTSQRKHELAAWEAENGGADVNDALFTTEILPTLQDLSLSTIASATGLSHQYCSLVRRGLKVPHRRHWELFRAIDPDRS
jgi:CRISPR-associated endonuclease Cas1